MRKTCGAFELLGQLSGNGKSSQKNLKLAPPNIKKTSFTRIYTSYLRSPLELNIRACPPILSRDSLVLVRVQRHANKRVKGLAGKSYTEKLKILDQFSLAFRRLKGDMNITH